MVSIAIRSIFLCVVLVSLPQMAAARATHIDYVNPISVGIFADSKALHTINVMVENKKTPLNVYHVFLYFNPQAISVTEVTLHENLCDPRFVITKTIDNATGVIELACGSALPFEASQAEPVISLSYVPRDESVSKDVRLGVESEFYIHDGKGTKAKYNTRSSSI